MTLKKKLAIALAVPALAYAGACIYLYTQQRKLLYDRSPKERVSGARVLRLRHDGETLRVLRVGPKHRADALVYFSGNAGILSAELACFRETFPKRTVYLVNYRGYGGSTGSPTEAGLFKDAVAVFDWVKSRHRRVALMGRSLGSGVAVFVAAMRPVEKLVLVTPYDSMENVAKRQFPIFPISWILHDKFASHVHAGAIGKPTLVLLAETDEVIPRQLSDALVGALGASVVSVDVIAGASHSTIIANADYWERVRKFV